MLAFQRPGSSSFDFPWSGFVVSYTGRFLSELPVLLLEQLTTQKSFLQSERHSLYRVAHAAQSRSLLLCVSSV